MNKYIACCFLFFIAFGVEQALAQDSTFIIDRYKWELGLGLNSNIDRSKPFSILLKKHVSTRTTWRFGLGFNYDKVYDKNLPIVEDYDVGKIFIAYEIDRKEKKLGVAVSTGIQRNYSIKNRNLYCALDFIMDYQLYKILSPNGIHFLDIRIPDGSSFTLFKEITNRGYSLSLKPLVGIAYPISRRVSISFETSLIYGTTFNRNQDFYYLIASESGNIISGFFEGTYDKNWTSHLNFSLIPLFTLNYHFD